MVDREVTVGEKVLDHVPYEPTIAVQVFDSFDFKCWLQRFPKLFGIEMLKMFLGYREVSAGYSQPQDAIIG